MKLIGYSLLEWGRHCIYKIECVSNNKFYIGRASCLRKRLSRHLWELRKNSHSNQYLQRCFDKYKEDNFRVVILEESNGDLIPIEEKFLEQEFSNPLNMNLIPYAYGGHASGEFHHNYGKSIPENVRKKMSDSHKGLHIGEKNCMFGKFGEAHSKSKLKESEVIEIRQLACEGISQRKLAKRYGVSRGCITGILSNKTWRHI